MKIENKPSPKYGALLLPVFALALANSAVAQQVRPETPAPQPSPAPVSEQVPEEEDLLVLSPFTVTTTKDQGYFAANTLAGSRMNTNLADIGASISVITMQQMEDTASTDINDIFRYEVNTEGSGTYTPSIQSSRGDGVIDANAGATQGNFSSYSNASANRVRGLGSPSAAINYFPAIGAVPFDSYNTQSVEISRGPNSMLFGLGSPAGIVNQSTASAQLNRRRATVSFRTDQYGSFRSALNFNQGLIHDKLAIYGAAVYDDRRFDRKPAYDKTKRYYAAVTAKPFRSTTIKANVEKYDNDNRRPNTLTPRDYVTEWNLAGQPYYDATTHRIYSNTTGATLGMIVNDAASPFANELRNFITTLPGYDASKWNAAQTTYNGYSIFAGATGYIGRPAGTTAGTGYVAGQASPNILYVPGIIAGGNDVHLNRSFMQIANGQVVGYYRPTYQYQYRPGFGTPTNPAANQPLYPTAGNAHANPVWADIYTRTTTSSGGWTGSGNGILNSATGYRYPGVTDKSIYDWTSVNLNSMNFGSAENTNYNVEIEQELPGDLFLSAGWFRQDYSSRNNYTVAQLNVATLYVDTNKYLPNGALNPYFGKPYVQDVDPDSYVNESLDDHYRAMIAWTPDFTQNKGWTKWLGRHQVLGLWSRDEYMATAIRQRLQYHASTSDTGRYRFMNNPNNNADGSPTGWNYQSTSLRRTYYLAAPGDPNGVVTRSAGYWDSMSYTGDIQVYDYDQSAFIPVTMTTTFSDFDANTNRNQRIVDSISGGITSYLWDNRLVATFGVREDTYKARVTNSGLPAVTDANGNIIAPAITNPQKWVNGVYQRDFLFNRWGPYGELKGTTRTLGGVLRPFQGWDSIERRASGGSQFWQFVRSFGFSYNTSDNFNPPSSALGDIYGNQLPKPTGDGKDYGIQFSLFDNKLFARVTWFEASSENENITNPQVFSRLNSNMDQTLFRNWARTITLINMQATNPGDNRFIPTAVEFGTNLNTAEEQAVQDAAEEIWQLPYDYYATRPYTLGATRNAEAEGVEAEINYNPTRNWTMKFTFGKQDTKYASVLKEFTPWNDQRMAVWRAADAADYLLPQYQGLATYTTNGGREVNLANFWSSYGYQSSVFPESAGANPEAIYNRDVVPQLALDRDLQGQSVQGQRKYRSSFLTTYTFSEGLLKGVSVGGSQRWEDKAVIGYLGKASGLVTNNYNGLPTLDLADTTKPVYDSDNFYTDLWVSYRRPIFGDKVNMKVQLNVNNVFEDGGLRPVAVNYDGTPYSYRIVDPRQFVLSATFEF
jgi:hypothetical protein